MIPLRDTTPTRNYPVVNTAIILINIAVYFLQLAQGADINHFIYVYGLVPARYSLPQIADYFTTGQQAFSLLSFMFLHGGFWHILGNMWSLYIFGDQRAQRDVVRFGAEAGLLDALPFLRIGGVHIDWEGRAADPVGMSRSHAQVFGARFDDVRSA